MTNMRQPDISRRDFIKLTVIGAAGTAAVPTVFAATSGTPAADAWKQAFRAAGFDPDASGFTYFITNADIHNAYNYGGTKGIAGQNLSGHVAYWNNMSPRPAFYAMLGDLGNVNGGFSDVPTSAKAHENATACYTGAIAELDKLDKSIPQHILVGNHDTYNGQTEIWREYFPADDQPLYRTFEVGGVKFFKLNTGNDGDFDEGQLAWLRTEIGKASAGQQLVFLGHDVNLGGYYGNRLAGQTIARLLDAAGRTGTNWLVGGHEHKDSFTAYQLKTGLLAYARHRWDRDGWWAYGIEGGKIVARIRMIDSNSSQSESDKGTISNQAMPESLTTATLVTAYSNVEEAVKFRADFGRADETSRRISKSPTGAKPLTYWMYPFSYVVHKLKKSTLAPTADRFAWMGMQRSGSTYKVTVSSDGTNYSDALEVIGSGSCVYQYRIPAEYVGATNLWVKVENLSYNKESTWSIFGGLALLEYDKLFVAQGGDDSGGIRGTRKMPLATLAEAVTCARAGDTICLEEGTYALDAACAVAKTLVIRGAEGTDPKKVVLLAGGTGHRAFDCSADVTFEGLTFKDFTGEATGGAIGGTGDVAINRCRFFSCAATGEGAAVGFTEGTQTVRNCLFADNGSYGATTGAASVVKLSGGTVESSTFVHNGAATGGKIVKAATAENNLFNDNTVGGTVITTEAEAVGN